MNSRHRFDPDLSQLTVHAFATGMLSFLGHNPTFSAASFTGSVDVDRDSARVAHIEMVVNATSLRLTDNVSAGDRREIENTMRNDVLETATFAEIRYESSAIIAEAIAPGRYRLRADGQLSIHGVTRAHPLEAEMLVFADGLRLRGESTVRLSEHRIKPVTALGGTIKLKDELQVSFDIAAVPEVS